MRSDSFERKSNFTKDLQISRQPEQIVGGAGISKLGKTIPKRGETAPKSPVARNNFNSSVSQRMGEDFCRKEEEDEENR